MNDTHRLSSIYAVVQSLLFCVFGGVFFLDHSAVVLGEPWLSPVGTLFAIFGLILMAAGFVALRGAVQIAPQPRRDATLVTNGIYRHLRHPMYSGIILVIAGLVLLKPTALVTATAIVVIGFLLLKVRLEEKLLLAHYPAYAAYRDQTWGVIPVGARKPQS